MSLIEGIGDEVTFLVAVITIFLVMAVAWMSTRVDAAPYTSIVIIDRERFVDLLRRLRGISSPSTTNTAHSSVPASVAAAEVSSTEVHPSSSSGETVNDSGPPESVSNQEISSAANVVSNSHESLAAAPVPHTGESALLSDVSAPTSQQSPDQSSSTASDSSANDTSSNKVQIRLQHIDGRQQTVLANPDDTIGHLKRSHFATELAANSIVRFIASGQELRDESSTLRSLQLGRSGAVIHCLVTPQRSQPASSSSTNVAAGGHQFDVGMLVFPLFGTVLVALWYARVVYRGYFNGTSTFSLFAVSFLYAIALFASLRGNAPPEQHAHVD